MAKLMNKSKQEAAKKAELKAQMEKAMASTSIKEATRKASVVGAFGAPGGKKKSVVGFAGLAAAASGSGSPAAAPAGAPSAAS